MAKVSAQSVKELKDMTNCGMMDCKRALEETNGDVQAAVKYLREKGLAKAAKKSGRIAAEGLVFAKVKDGKAVLVEVNSETDFAAKADRFIEFVEIVADTVLANDVKDAEALKEVNAAGTSEKLADVLVERIATIGENINIRRFAKLTGGAGSPGGGLYSYVHNGGGSIIGSIIKVEGSDAKEDEVAHDLLLQITASAPVYVSRDDISPQAVEEEHQVQLAIAKKENEESEKPKPEQVIEKIVEGRMRKYAESVALLEQPFVKNPDITVGQYIKQTAPALTVAAFNRFEKGEGIEKKADDFAAEVASLTA
ncbi:elongation factor Ts [Clostridia bacterium]|nr:elongation factor Ts [Clostridia bacterium]